MGLGTVVGTLVGGVASIPTTGLGILAGATAGAIHGPFIKVGGEEKKWENAKPEEVVDALEQEQDAQKRAELERGLVESKNDDQENVQPKKKPRKLEVRSVAQLERLPSPEKVERRKPRKIEMRSQPP